MPSSPPPSAAEAAPEPAVAATALPTEAPTPAPAATAKPTAAAKADAGKTKPAAAPGKIRLRSLNVIAQGEGADVVIDSDADELRYTLSRANRPGDYVIDLAGQWTLPKGTKLTRNFDSGAVMQIRAGVHERYFRVVVALRDGSRGAPVIVRDGGRLRIEVR